MPHIADRIDNTTPARWIHEWALHFFHP